MLENFMKTGKLSMILDGQFGSTGKGLIAAVIAENCHIDIAVARLSPNAGHTFYHNDKKYVSKLIPVAGIMQENSTIFLSQGCVIDTDILLKEISEYDISHDRIVIHPRAAVITEQDKEEESRKGGLSTIASTLSGAGAARASKIMRKNPLAAGTPCLQRYIHPDFSLQRLLDEDCSALCETGQGFDLSINVGLDYPHCTSIDVIPSAVLADCGLHPKYLGNIMMTVRTFPIRVGNILHEDGSVLGHSGPVYDDSIEMQWEDLKITPELTTITQRVRRVFSFSHKQYERAISAIQPTHVFLNFINYLREQDLSIFSQENWRKPDYVGYGPFSYQVRPWDQEILKNMLYKYH